MNLKPDSYIIADAKFLDADISYVTTSHNIFGQISRLAYNRDGSPIKVVLNKNLNVQTKKNVRYVYEQIINPLFQVLNPNYAFEVIEEQSYNVPSTDNVVIYVGYKPELDNPFNADGQVYYSSFLHPFDNSISKYYTFADIKLWKDVGVVVVMHEILHTFGFDDVYKIENYSTLLKTGTKLAVYKPNDIKALAAMYYHGADLTGIKAWIEDYTLKYYSLLSESIYSDKLYADPYFKQPIHLAPLLPPSRQATFTGISEKRNLSFEIILDGAGAQGGCYIMTIWDKTANKKYFSQGTYHCGLGKIFLGVAEFGFDGSLMKIDLVLAQEYGAGPLLCVYGTSFDIFFGEKIILSLYQTGDK